MGVFLHFEFFGNIFPKRSRALPKSVKSLLQFETFLCSVVQILCKTQGHINIDVFPWFKICMKESTGNITLLRLHSQQNLQDEHQSYCCPLDDWCICFEEINSFDLLIPSCTEMCFEFLDDFIWITFALMPMCWL